MTNFIIFTTQRSGSTVLTKTLDEHPQVFVAGEIFHTNNEIHHPEWHFPFKNYLGKGTARGMLMKVNKALNNIGMQNKIKKHLDAFYTATEAAETARGFKLMQSQVKSNPAIWQYIKNNDVKIIVLVRKNIFETALSRYRGRETKVYHSDSTTTQKQKLQIPVAEFTAWLRTLEEANKKLLQQTEGMNRLVLYYEDFANWNNILQQTFGFLQVDMIAIPPALQKVGAKDWRAGIENYEELEKALQQTNYAGWLN
ncbi:sulfotransferase [Panacibacter sp. DH6]|uniref:Sulfotransferase n=1 Tax=Panacibacter microcysteis TaxID=2793269 RepID=A0A931E1E9_9BACT|nr:sulfotransferase [Panacibacter microcysteis]MBG9376852.1 sulfotransferase [Panacibacter microcysteis]